MSKYFYSRSERKWMKRRLRSWRKRQEAASWHSISQNEQMAEIAKQRLKICQIQLEKWANAVKITNADAKAIAAEEAALKLF
jgi:hypothetical protein